MSSSLILYDALGNPIEFDADRLKFGLATAWVSADALTGNIFESYNVSSVVRNGAGDFTIFFATPMDTANYGVMSNGRNVTSLASTPQDVNSVRIVEYNSSGTAVNGTIITVATFGGIN